MGTKIKSNQENKPEIKKDSFANYIINLREKRHLTQKALAEKIKVSDRTISKWENGLTVPDLINIRNICKELGVSANSVVLEKKTLYDYFKDFLHLLSILWKHIYNNIFKVIFAIIFILLLIYFINNYNSISMYILNSDNDDITFSNGYYIRSKVDTILVIDNIKLKNVDYNEETDSLKMELYLLVNGDKVIIYEDDQLEDIFMNELTGYKNTFTKDVNREITKGIYLNITINNTRMYETKITLRKNFSNNKLIYNSYKSNDEYNSDYQRFIGIADTIKLSENNYGNYNSNFLNSLDGFTYNATSEVNTFTAEVDNDNKLKDLGYTYDKETDTYTKIDGDKTITYKPQFNWLINKEVRDDIEYSTYYYILNDRIDYYGSKNDNSKEPLISFKYFVDKKDLKCKIGNCENYQSEIDYILAEYQQILTIL